MLNKLLIKQYQRNFGSEIQPEGKLADFLKVISDTYNHLEKDRKLLEQTMELNSAELTINNQKLRKETDDNKIALQKLKGSMSILMNDNKEIFDENREFKIIDIATILLQEIERRKIAEEKQLEHLQNLEKINKELDQFAYVVSHDLKAPLRAISSLSDWIEEDINEQLSEDAKHNFTLLRGRTQRMENLIQGILSYAKAGKQKGEVTSVNINKLLLEITDSLSIDSHIKLNIAENLPTITAEKIKIQQVFSNLLSNAIKYGKKKDSIINIGFQIKKNFIEFYVEDNGPGIEKEYHEKIFIIFQTLYARDQFESTGIGLSIVKKIVTEQNGNIWVESIVGHGSKFIFTWPIYVPKINQEDKLINTF
jgi:light-regulated signal transduction histidine kinase (bacteriophytochrome)